jgi:hypothetical protein
MPPSGAGSRSPAAIGWGLAAGESYRRFGRRLSRSASIITGKAAKNKGRSSIDDQSGFTATRSKVVVIAHSRRIDARSLGERRHHRHRVKSNAQLRQLLEQLLEQRWSPQQIRTGICAEGPPMSRACGCATRASTRPSISPVGVPAPVEAGSATSVTAARRRGRPADENSPNSPRTAITSSASCSSDNLVRGSKLDDFSVCSQIVLANNSEYSARPSNRAAIRHDGLCR